MCDIGTDHVLTNASEGRTSTYGKVWEAVERGLGKEVGNRFYAQPHLVAWMTRRFAGDHRLMLSALVVNAGDDEGPGPGFFRFACELGLLPEDEAPHIGEPWLGMSPAQRDFWERQVRELLAFAQNRS
jgi:hypothetical protein